VTGVLALGSAKLVGQSIGCFGDSENRRKTDVGTNMAAAAAAAAAAAVASLSSRDSPTGYLRTLNPRVAIIEARTRDTADKSTTVLFPVARGGDKVSS
jgi:uncharacterized oligopeptide transporter (OPT) family protein